MDNLEGMLMVPPERGQILGRAVWKLRYVVVGRRNTRLGLGQSQSISNGRNNSLGGGRSFPKLPTEESCILIYKHKVYIHLSTITLAAPFRSFCFSLPD
jgi:hypothetical protein